MNRILTLTFLLLLVAGGTGIAVATLLVAKPGLEGFSKALTPAELASVLKGIAANGSRALLEGEVQRAENDVHLVQPLLVVRKVLSPIPPRVEQNELVIHEQPVRHLLVLALAHAGVAVEDATHPRLAAAER